MAFTVGTTRIPSAHFNGESTLPSIYSLKNVQQHSRSKLGEDDGLFLGYGFISSIFPYRMQDCYDRALDERDFLSVTLENEHLKAVFLPELGGRLWSLYDKDAGCDLLYTNTVVRPCNLAVRNAWLSGGVEFNCGMVGHHPFTCSPIFAARAALDDGTPVLRMYEYERIRGVVYQMDFFLPEGARLLYARMRIVNPREETIPMYWWSNIAVPEGDDYRNVIDARSAYTTDKGYVVRVKTPKRNGIDVTYPTRNPVAIDYFWNIPAEKRKFTAYLNGEGHGLIQCSTSRLQGRKLFVWGQGSGGDRWQEFLTDEKTGRRYVEIQAGLAHTQFGCLPMPPRASWEWLEGYGGMQADPARVHGAFPSAVAEVKSRLNEFATAHAMEKMLKDTRKMALTPAAETICVGSGWGALERARRKASGEGTFFPHLDFGEIGEEQKPWLALLETGAFPARDVTRAPLSWMKQEAWTALLEKSADSHDKYLQLAATRLADLDVAGARAAIDRALAYTRTAPALFVAAQVARREEKNEEAGALLREAVSLAPDDVSLARQALEFHLSAGMNAETVGLFDAMPDEVRRDGRVKMYAAFACVRGGRIAEAEDLLWQDGGLEVTDIREGEVTLSGLYTEIERAKAARDGRAFDEATLEIPHRFDFRMSVAKK